MSLFRIILEVLICLPILASAAPDSTIIGAFNVSFDLGLPKEAYNINISDQKIKEDLSGHISTEYEIQLINKTGLSRKSTIKLTSYEDELVIPTQDELMEQLKQALEEKLYSHDIKVAARKMDGHDGAASSWKRMSVYEEIDHYTAIYYLSSETTVTLFSSYPWEEGTLQLLKTIHVEENPL